MPITTASSSPRSRWFNQRVRHRQKRRPSGRRFLLGHFYDVDSEQIAIAIRLAAYHFTERLQGGKLIPGRFHAGSQFFANPERPFHRHLHAGGTEIPADAGVGFTIVAGNCDGAVHLHAMEVALLRVIFHHLYAQLSVFLVGLSMGMIRASSTPPNTRPAPRSMKSDSLLASRRSFSAVSTSRSFRSFWFSSRNSRFRRSRLIESAAIFLMRCSSVCRSSARLERLFSAFCRAFRSSVTVASCCRVSVSSARAWSSCWLTLRSWSAAMGSLLRYWLDTQPSVPFGVRTRV